MKHNEVTNMTFVGQRMQNYVQRYKTENIIANNEQRCLATDVSTL